MTDAELIEELRHGSVKAFGMIYDRYVKRLYAYCFPYLKSHQLTEEVVQDVFVNLWRYRDRLEAGRDLSALLFMVARRYRINALRAVINAPIFEDYIDYQNSIMVSDGLSHLDYDDLQHVLMKLLKRLPRTQRKVFEMSRLEHKSNEEIAEALRLSEKSVANQLSLSLKKLREALRNIHYFITPLIVFITLKFF